MSVLGKVLIFLNLLAAGAFTYLALENWKLRQEIAFTAFQREVQLVGIPVGDANPPKVGSDEVPFPFQVNAGTRIEAISKETLAKIIPKGDESYGGEAVETQNKEIERLKKKVIDSIPELIEANPNARFALLQMYLLNLARAGSERDGVLALFDMLDESKTGYARRDLAFLGRTTSLVSALKALVDIAALNNPKLATPENRGGLTASARESIKRLVLGEVSFGVASNDDEARRKLDNSVKAAVSDRGGNNERDAVIAAATADTPGFTALADLAINKLQDKAAVDAARASILSFVTSASRIKTPSELTAMTEVTNVIFPAGDSVVKSVNGAATALLNQKFDEAALPAASKTENNGNPAAEKARRIAHVLYHIDAHRENDKQATEARKQWHTRVATIIGMSEYVKAAEAQANEYADATQRLVAAITEEQSAFEDSYFSKVQRIRSIHSQWLALVAQLEQQEAITAENKRLRGEREQERDKLKDQLANAIQDAKVAEENRYKSQVRLFASQKDLRDAQQALFVLEKQLRELEGVTGR